MSAGAKNLLSRFTGLFLDPADARVYAAVRIGFACTALLNLMQIWPDRESFFTDAGMVDHETVRKYTVGLYESVFYFCTDLSAVSTYMIFSGAAMVMLMLGIWPRVAAVAVYVWHLSYSIRAPLVLVGWDEVLRCTSFLVMVSPLPACWCLQPAKARRKAAAEPPPLRYGLTPLQVQLAGIYIHAVLARLGDEFWMSGDFMSFFLLSHNARWPGLWVLNYGTLLKGVTYLVLLMELAIPVLLMVRRWRWYGIAAGVLLHAGISMMAYNLMLFFLSMMMLYLSFLQKEDMDWLERKLGRRV